MKNCKYTDFKTMRAEICDFMFEKACKFDLLDCFQVDHIDMECSNNNGGLYLNDGLQLFGSKA